jgi:tRNA 2-selenouridine synthase
MAVSSLPIDKFLSFAQLHPVLDVRSPGEYEHAHIPGAYTLPLFTDEERKLVGTAYKQESKQRAIKYGLNFFGKKMVQMIEETESILQRHYSSSDAAEKIVLVHCWRGGMRSAGVAWLLELYGYTVYSLKGGYKAYRNHVLKQFRNDYHIRLLGGYTGTGKTVLLRKLAERGEATIDLEAIANHKGSAFGNLEMLQQPSQEMFENILATRLSEIRNSDAAVIWVEDESQRIGLVNIPGTFLQTMRKTGLIFLNISFEERLRNLVTEYGHCDKTSLEAAINRIWKRLGGLQTKNALQYLAENNIPECFRVLLTYYDKHYNKALKSGQYQQDCINELRLNSVDPDLNVSLILQEMNKKNYA